MGLPPRCRFIPTCSQYAVEAIAKYGAAKGGWLALKRFLAHADHAALGLHLEGDHDEGDDQAEQDDGQAIGIGDGIHQSGQWGLWRL